MTHLRLSYVHSRAMRKDGRAAVRMRVQEGNSQKTFCTGVYLKPEEWDEDLHKVKQHPNQELFNLKLDKLRINLQTYILQEELKDKKMTLEQVTVFFKGAESYSFAAFIEDELETDNRISKPTKYHHKTTLKYLKEYAPKARFRDIDFSFVDGFDNFLYGKKQAVNTVYEHHKRIKKFINLAIRKQLIEYKDNPYIYFKPKQVPTNRIALSDLEVQGLAALDLSKETKKVQLVRDAFLFQCYTGLRFSDVSSLDAHNFRRTENGLELYKLMQKTVKHVFLPLSHLFNGEGEELIKPYLAKFRKSKDKNILQLPCNQVTNRMLKKLAELAHTRPITSHIGRHTFVTNVTALYGIEIAQELAGHSKIQTTLKYFHKNKKLLIKKLKSA